SGSRYGAALSSNHKYDLLPDFIIYRGVAAGGARPTAGNLGADYDDSNPTYCAGFFDHAWQLVPGLTWTHDGTARPKPAAAPAPPDPKRQAEPAVP
ncbi:unnamed protein product, partial [marine sediment metagenome]